VSYILYICQLVEEFVKQTFVLSLVFLQYMLPAVQRTLKTRYKLTEKEVTGLYVAQGISLMVSVLLVGFFGNFRAMKIRCIGAGMALSGKTVVRL
jgi:hypothetical protein